MVRHAGNANKVKEGSEHKEVGLSELQPEGRGQVQEGVIEDVLPGHSDIRPERAKIELIGGVQNFDPKSPARGRGKEPNGGTELARQERGHQAVQREIAKEREKDTEL